MLYIFDKDDNFKNIITEDTGLIDTWFKDYQNHLIDEPFVFHVDSESELLPLIVAENQVAFKHTFNALQQDVDMLKLMRIKEIDEIYNSDGYMVKVTCEPSWLELYDHFIEDRRIDNGRVNTALTRALNGSRWVGQVVGDGFGNGSTNFYWIDAVEALFKIAEEWGGTLQDYITLDENNEIATRIMYLLPRLGRDNGLLIQPGYNAETIERRTLSYPVTAIWGQGASLEIEDNEGELTGGHTRYITFEDVEWKVSNGDPVDKPKGQKWIGDPDALARYGYLKADGSRMHRFGHFSNQDYETPEELLWATWEALQKEKESEIYHEATIYEVDKPIFLGDTGIILDRHYGKPIEVQSQITGLEYDILKPTESVNIVLGNYKDMSRDPLEDEIDEIKKEQGRPPIINDNSFPDVKPGKPVNVEAVGMFRAVLISWAYSSKIYMSHYEVYASQTADFVPDAQFLVYRGRVSSFGHEVGSNETWYYRVRAVNTHGTTSEFSVEVSASSTRIDFIDMEDEIKAEIDGAKDRAEEAHGNANIAAGNAAEAIVIAQGGFDKALESLGKADESFNLAQDSFNKAQENAESIDGLGLLIGDLEGNYTSISGTVQGLQTQVVNIEGDVTTVTQLANGLQTQISDAQGDIFQLQSTAQGLLGRIESVNTRLDELDGDDRNLITHLPENWENGTISSTTGATTTNSTSWVRLVDYYPLKGGEVVTLSSYNEYNVYIYMYTENKAFVDFVQSGYDGSRTFTVSSSVRYFKIGIRNREATSINPSIIGTDLKSKLSYDDKRTDWTPNFNDTGELVNNVQKFVHDFSITAEGLASQIEDNQGNINQIANTVDGWQQTVSNLQGDVNTVTNIAEASQQQLSNLEGDVNTLTSTANSLVSRIENIGGRNLIENSRGDSLDSWVAWGNTSLSVYTSTSFADGNEWIWSTKGEGNQVGVHTPPFDLKANEKYIISFTIRSLSNSGYQLNYLYLRAGKSTLTSVKRLPSVNMRDDKFKGDIAGDGLRVWFEFSHSEDVEDARVLLAINDRPENAGFVIRELQVEQSEVVNDWQPAPEDAYSQFSQLQNAINLRVKEGDVINQINIDTSGILISGEKLILDGDTTVNGNFRVKDANIAALSAGKLTGGTADFAKFSAININANSINSGTFDADKAYIRGGSSTEYTRLEGDLIYLRGKYTRTWKGQTHTSDITTRLRHGHLRFRDESRSESLYISHFGMSTFVDGDGAGSEVNGSSGTIEWWDRTYSPSDAKGITMSSWGGVVALRSDLSHVVLDSYQSARIESRNSVVFISPKTNKSGNNHFWANLVDNINDGFFMYGSSETNAGVGLRFNKSSSDNTISVVDHNYDRGGNTTFDVGNLKVNNITKRNSSTSVYWNGTSGGSTSVSASDNTLRASGIRANSGSSDIFLATNDGAVRVTDGRGYNEGNGITYRPIAASNFSQQSSREYKTNITSLGDTGLAVINNLNIVEYDLLGDTESGKQVGLIAEDSPSVTMKGELAINLYKLTSYNTKATQELSVITDDLNLKIDLTREELVLKIAKLEHRINELECAA